MKEPVRPTPPTERADARANRRRLLDAAVAVFAERGADAEIRE
ncbi:MAG: TetR family transcriptional regulator, partial [Chloroflexota bacterium]